MNVEKEVKKQIMETGEKTTEKKYLKQ